MRNSGVKSFSVQKLPLNLNETFKINLTMKNLVLLLTLFVFACTPPPPAEDSTEPPWETVPITNELLILSESGGFAGQTQEWQVAPNGTVQYRTGPTQNTANMPLESLGQLPKEQTEQLFGDLRKLDLASGHNEPGNMTYRIAHLRDGKLQQVLFGGGNDPLPESFNTFYKDATRMIRALGSDR